MHLEGTLRLRAPRERVRGFFTDPREVLNCFAEPHSIRVTDASHFEGETAMGVAFLRGTFRFTGEYLPVESRQEVRVRLRGSGVGSELEGELSTDMSETDGHTVLHWSIDLVFRGAAAALGEWLIRRTVDARIASLFETARQRLEAE